MLTAVAAVRQGPTIGARLGLGSNRPQGTARELATAAG
jgi:hypothetical protein